MRKRILAAIVIAGVVVLGTGAIAFAGGGDDAGEAVTGSVAERAARAAIDAIGGGTVRGVERGDGGGAAWEVEVTIPDGSAVEVLLDERYQLVATENEGSDDGGEGESEDGTG